MSTDRAALGERGERIAERWLCHRGWRTLARRFRNGHRDLDLVVQRAQVIAFVEVKTRQGTRCGHPVEAVHWRKQRELVRSAHVWIERFGSADLEYRFDVVGVVVEDGRVRVRHVENAFALRGDH